MITYVKYNGVRYIKYVCPNCGGSMSPDIEYDEKGKKLEIIKCLHCAFQKDWKEYVNENREAAKQQSV